MVLLGYKVSYLLVGLKVFFSFDVFQGFVGKSGDKGVGGTVVSCKKSVFFLYISS